EELVRPARAGQHEERRGAPEVRLLLDERFEDADGGLRIDLELPVVHEIAELAGRGVVQRQHDRRRAGWHDDIAIAQAVQRIQPVPPASSVPLICARTSLTPKMRLSYA